MSNEDNVIDVECEEVDNLPAVIPRETYVDDEPIKARTDGRDWPHGPSPERRCRAHKKTGEPCKNAAIQGATVCRFHGGAARHVKAAARARLDNAADLMARKLLGLAVGADSETVQLSATNSVLDRVGIVKPAEVVVSQGESKPWQEVYDGITTATREESRAARGYSAGISPTPSATAFNASAQEATSVENASGVEEYDDFDPFEEPDRPLYVDTDVSDYDPNAPGPRAPRTETDRDRGTQSRHARPRQPQHLTGDDALRVAAELAREQRAIESPHKRYRRP